jgi:hypothetical protein
VQRHLALFIDVTARPAALNEQNINTLAVFALYNTSPADIFI